MSKEMKIDYLNFYLQIFDRFENEVDFKQTLKHALKRIKNCSNANLTEKQHFTISFYTEFSKAKHCEDCNCQ